MNRNKNIFGPSFLCSVMVRVCALLLLGGLMQMTACSPSAPSQGACQTDDDCQSPKTCRVGLCVTADKDKDGYPADKDCDDNDRTVGPGESEICDNGKDDNCNGKIDEKDSCICKDGQKRECGTDKGECTKGRETCVLGVWGECRDAKEPQEETCDGKDNDCDGAVDEDIAGCCKPGETKSCGTNTGACTQGQQTCKEGTWSSCEGEGTPTEEVCDGKDNDCDGKTDNIKNKDDLLFKTCYSGDPSTVGKGKCKEGKQLCENGAWSACKDEFAPKAEECNGEDDDCDGKTDNVKGEDKPMRQECYAGDAGTKGVGPCKAGEQVCAQGKWSACQGEIVPRTEDCNGVDDDCDGSVDNNKGETTALFKTCYTGPASTSGKGECKEGKQLCEQGVWKACSGDTTPQLDTCDGKDNDCDGLVDNVANGTDPLSRSCYNGAQGTQGVGPCKEGKETCQNGAWTSCVGAVLPGTEVCDGKDNDCNGQVDDGNPGGGATCDTGKLGPCKAGTETCTQGQLQCVPDTKPEAEKCDGKDNDCDGGIDNGNPGGGQTCPVPNLKGLCAQGTTACLNDKLVCQQTNQPNTEVCDGKDNDCDGQTDENLTQTCYTSTRGCTKQSDGSYRCTGACKTGTQTCQNGTLSTCRNQVVPKAESCNNLDDDCDGSVDENWSRKGSACSVGQGNCRRTGTYICNSAGTGTTCSATAGSGVTERACNGIDDDCDGTVDEAKCAAGQQCSNGACAACSQPSVKYCFIDCGSCDLTCNCGYVCKIRGAFLGEEEYCTAP